MPDLSLSNPSVFLKATGDYDVGILDGPFGGYFVLDRCFDDGVWLADGPPLDKLDWRRGLLWVTLGRAGIHPGRDEVSFRLRQRAVVLKLADAAVREPWRHLPSEHGFLDGFRPRPRVAI